MKNHDKNKLEFFVRSKGETTNNEGNTQTYKAKCVNTPNHNILRLIVHITRDVDAIKKRKKSPKKKLETPTM